MRIHNVELHRRSWGLKQTFNKWPRYDSQSNERANLKVILCGIKKKLHSVSSNSKFQFTQAPDQVAPEGWVPKPGSYGAYAQRHAVWTLQAGMHASPTQHTHTNWAFSSCLPVLLTGGTIGRVYNYILNQRPWCFPGSQMSLLHTFTKLLHS